MESLYTILPYLTQPLVWLRLLLRSRKTLVYRKRWAERYGFRQGKIEPDGILLHSISVGETLAATPLIHALHHRYPSMLITVTTVTPTGSERAMSALGRDAHYAYLPYDPPGAMNRFLSIVQPRLAIVMEIELWSSMATALHERKIPLMIANARLFKRSTKGYVEPGGFMRRLLSRITLITTQNEEDGNCFLVPRLRCNQLTVAGGLKFDISVTPELAACAITLRRQWMPHRKVWIATSTHDGEEQTILWVHKKLLETFLNLLLILVPWHPERFPGVHEMMQRAGMSFTLRDTGEIPSFSTQVVIGGTMGEPMLFYGIVDLALVGGSLVEHNGHNPLEPTAHAIPVLTGPHTFNFKDTYVRPQQGDGLVTVTDVDLLVREVSTLSTDEDYHLWCDRRTMEVLHQNQGVLSHLFRLLQPYMPQRSY